MDCAILLPIAFLLCDSIRCRATLGVALLWVLFVVLFPVALLTGELSLGSGLDSAGSVCGAKKMERKEPKRD